MPEIVAFLQNQWFKDPDGVKRLFARHPEQRRDLLSIFLFRGCLTGRRLQSAFGEELCNDIVWEEASREIGGRSSSVFPADPEHIRSTIEALRPRIVLTFGKVAAGGVAAALPLLRGEVMIRIIGGPHPAARHATVTVELRDMAAAVRNAVAHV